MSFDLKKYLAEGKLHEENPNQLDIFSPITVNIDKDVSIGRDYYNKVWLEFRENWARQNGIKYKSSNELNNKIIDHFKIPYPENKNFPDSAEWLEDQGILKIQAEGKLQKEQMDSSTVDVKLLLLDLRNTIADFDNDQLTAQEFRDEIAVILYEVENSNLYNLREADQDELPPLEDTDDEYTTYCDLCDMESTYSDDTPYGTCMCS